MLWIILKGKQQLVWNIRTEQSRSKELIEREEKKRDVKETERLSKSHQAFNAARLHTNNTSAF